MSLRPRPRGLRGLVWPAVVAAALITGLALARPAALGHLDGRVYDLLLRQVTHGPASERVTIVDVDERSLARFGRWPWPRSRVAAVLAQVRAMGAASVGLDVMFPEADESEGRAAGGADGLTPGDAALAGALGTGPFVLGYEFTFGAGGASGEA